MVASCVLTGAEDPAYTRPLTSRTWLMGNVAGASQTEPVTQRHSQPGPCFSTAGVYRGCLLQILTNQELQHRCTRSRVASPEGPAPCPALSWILDPVPGGGSPSVVVTGCRSTSHLSTDSEPPGPGPRAIREPPGPKTRRLQPEGQKLTRTTDIASQRSGVLSALGQITNSGTHLSGTNV